MTTDLNLSGGAGQEHDADLLGAHRARARFQTSNVALRNFPGMEKIVDVTKLQILNNPTMQAIKTAFQIKEGRLVLQPFDVKLAGMTMNVAGSNGIDQSLEYDLGLKVPRSLLGGGANQAIAGLVSKAGRGPQCGAGDPARDSARRHGDQSVVKVDVGSLDLVGGEGRRAGGEAGGHAEGRLRRAAAGAGGGAAGRGDPAAGRVAGGEGEAGRATSRPTR